jgi:hypothetical protein
VGSAYVAGQAPAQLAFDFVERGLTWRFGGSEKLLQSPQTSFAAWTLEDMR